MSTNGSHNVRVGDFDDDGDIDIVGANWRNEGTGSIADDGAKVYLWRNLLVNGQRKLPLDAWTRRVIGVHDNSGGDPPARGLFVRAADLDGDGAVDVTDGNRR